MLKSGRNKKKRGYYYYALIYLLIYLWGTRQRSWLRHYATNRKVVGSSPDEVIGFFN
jgi:hypothetical protein